MQHNKSNKSLSEINSYCKNSSTLVSTFNQLLSQFELRYINQLFSRVKSRGIDGRNIFKTLFVLRFLDFGNVFQLISSGFSKELGHQKDVLYDFLKNPKVQWRQIVMLFFKQTIALIEKKSIDQRDKKSRGFLVLDDSTLHKTGKTMELIGKVFDHCSHSYQLGMKLLTLGYFDGKSFFPVDFSIHNEPGKNQNRGMKKSELRSQFSKKRDDQSSGWIREKEISTDKITQSIEMIKRCFKLKWLKVDYVLADSWFITERFIRQIRKLSKEKLHVIGLMKTNRIITMGGKTYKADKVPELKRKYIHYNRKFKCHYINISIQYKGINMRGYWIKMKGQSNWNLLISTDESLSFSKVMEYYKNRWSIEVFFKDCKQNLGLETCRSTDLDAHIATISLVFMNYTLLSLKRRFDDYESLGILFRSFKSLLLKETIIRRLWKVLTSLFDSILTDLNLGWEEITRIIINVKKDTLQKVNMTFESLFQTTQPKIA